MITSASINLWIPCPAVVQVWGFRSFTIYCDVCKFNTTHNGAAHWAGRHQQQEPS
jgi:hypothetical protein